MIFDAYALKSLEREFVPVLVRTRATKNGRNSKNFSRFVILVINMTFRECVEDLFGADAEIYKRKLSAIRADIKSVGLFLYIIPTAIKSAIDRCRLFITKVNSERNFFPAVFISSLKSQAIFVFALEIAVILRRITLLARRPR